MCVLPSPIYLKELPPSSRRRSRRAETEIKNISTMNYGPIRPDLVGIWREGAVDDSAVETHAHNLMVNNSTVDLLP
jgi:hypothetical protein